MSAPIDPPLVRGDFVIVEAEGRAVRAMVGLASNNGLSVILHFEAVLGGWVGSMPALFVGDEWQAINGMPILMRRTTNDDTDDE